MRWSLPLLALAAGCAAPAVAPQGRCAREAAIQDGDAFETVAARAPEAGPLCLRYHRATAEVSWAVAPRVPAPVLTVTRSSIELHEDGKLVGAWYGACQGTPALRATVSPEATHYMIRYLALRRPPSVEVRVGAKVSAVDLMFALETMTDFGHHVFLNPRPITELPACLAPEAELAMASTEAPVALDDRLLGAVAQPRLPLLRSCFRRTVRPLPCSSLVRRVDLQLDGRGMVVDATVADHTFGTPEVDACVGAAIWDLVFPPTPDGQPRQATLRFQNCERAVRGCPDLDIDDKEKS